MARTVRAALVQAEWTGDKESMIAKHEKYAREAAKQGAQIMCFQELFYGPYFPQVQDPAWYSYAESVPGPIVERFQALGKHLRLGEPGCVPGVRVARNQVQHAWSLAGDEQPRHRIGGGWCQLGVRRAVESAAEVDAPVAEEGCDDLQRLVETAYPMAERVIEGPELRLMPATAEAEDEAAAAGFVEGRRHLGGQRRVAKSGGQHERAQLAERGPGFVDAARWLTGCSEEEMVGAPQRVEPIGFGAQRHLGQRSERRGSTALVLADGQHQTDHHAPAPGSCSASILWLAGRRPTRRTILA
jgi:hypothetical protein